MPQGFLTTHAAFLIRVVSLLLIAVASYGISIGRPILQDGGLQYPFAEVSRFPYPLTITLIELVTALVLFLTIWFCIPILRSSALKRPFGDNSGHLLIALSSNNSAAFEPDEGGLQKVLPWFSQPVIFTLALCVASERALTNYALWNIPLEVVILFRALVLPVSIVFSSVLLRKKEPSIPTGTLLPSGLLSIGVFLAGYRSDLPWPTWPARSAGAAAILAGLWPTIARYDTVSETDPSGGLRDSSTSNQWRYTSQILVQLTLIAIAIISVALYFSDEPGSIWRNCYTATMPILWFRLFMNALCYTVYLGVVFLQVSDQGHITIVFLTVLSHSFQVVQLTSVHLLFSQNIGLALSALAGLWLLFSNRHSALRVLEAFKESQTPDTFQSRPKSSWRVIFIALIALALFFTVVLPLSYQPIPPPPTRKSNPPIPVSDAFLGSRPAQDTTADLWKLVETCRGSYSNLENIRHVRRCTDFLYSQQSQYLLSAKNEDDDQKRRLIRSDEHSAESLKCSGRTVLYHIWWTGLPSWRTELFIKSYFYTQNLACSQLWIWVNADKDPDAAANWVGHPSFAKFLPFLDSGKISLREWQMPPRVQVSPMMDELDKARYYSHPRAANTQGLSYVADSIVRDESGTEYIQFYEEDDTTQLKFFTVASSDAARLTILHQHGGVYLDVDILLLRDMRPLILPGLPFSERWGAWADPTQYNNAIVALPAQSPMSNYLLNGGTRMGLTYHFMNIGKMLVGDGRDDVNRRGLLKLESAFFDPLWPRLDGSDDGECLTPCLDNYEAVFKAKVSPNEWNGYRGAQVPASPDGNNRTLENFFPGSFAYHMHNQWHTQYESGSWIDVVVRAHNGFFEGSRTNLYNETWQLGGISGYGT